MKFLGRVVIKILEGLGQAYGEEVKILENIYDKIIIERIYLSFVGTKMYSLC